MMTAVGEDRKQEVEVLDRKIAIATPQGNGIGKKKGVLSFVEVVVVD